MTKAYADNEHLNVGGHLTVETPSGASGTMVIRGIYDPPSTKPLLGEIAISQQTFDRSFTQPKNGLTLLDASAAAGTEIKSMTNGFGDATYHTGAAYPKDATKDMATMLAMLYVLLGFSVIVSLFGMVNTMVLSVFERTREIGMLRTLGMTRRQARRMIRHESVITSLIGATLGIVLGLVLAGLLIARVDFIEFSFPTTQVIVFAIAAILVGILAAIFPARRAAKLNPLEALHYE